MPKCLRCNKEYENPIPPVTNPEGELIEIACKDWCPDCNALTMSLVFRDSSIYSIAYGKKEVIRCE